MEYKKYREEFSNGVRLVALESWHYTYNGIFEWGFINEYVERNYSREGLNSSLSRIEEGKEFFEVAVDDGKPIAFCNIGKRGNEWELFRIYVLPKYFGKGIGKVLLSHGENFLKAKAAIKYFCFVHKRNELGKGFYLKSGFVHIYEKDKEDEWYMEKEML